MTALLADKFSMLNSPRRQRALLDFIGSISKSLFGTATMKDVRNLAAHIQILEGNAQANDEEISKLLDAVSHVTNTTNARIETLAEQINFNYKYLLNATKEFARWTSSFRLSTIGLQQRLESLNNTVQVNKQMHALQMHIILSLQEIDAKLTQFIEGLHRLATGNLPDQIIPVSQLHTALHAVKKELLVNYPSYQLVHKEPAFYYNQHFSTYVFTDDNYRGT